MRALILTATLLALAGCAGPNTDIRNIQFSGDTAPLPTDYQARAAKAVADLPIAPGATLTFSEPRTVVGQTAFSPKRWYVCARGIAAPGAKPQGVKPITQFLDEWFAPAQSEGRYDVVVVFTAAGLTSLHKSFDAQLCDV